MVNKSRSFYTAESYSSDVRSNAVPMVTVNTEKCKCKLDANKMSKSISTRP